MGHSRLRRLFFWTAGSEPDSIVVRRDIVRHGSIGAAVWLTTAISSVSAFIALRLAFEASVFGAAFGAAIWALFIFNTDRMLVGGRTEWVDDDGRVTDGKAARAGVWLFRIGLSLLLALAITEPLIVQLFTSEITAQKPADDAAAKRRFQEENAASPGDAGRRAGIEGLRLAADKAHGDTVTAENEATRWAAAAQCEKAGQVDCGPGVPAGTGVAGVDGEEYQNKLGRSQTAQTALETARTVEKTARETYEKENGQLQSDIAGRLVGGPAVGAGDGFFARSQALENYLSTRPGADFIRWVLVGLLIMVDMSAVLLKGLFRDAEHDRRELAKAMQQVSFRRALALEQAKADKQTTLDKISGMALIDRAINKARRDVDREVGLAEVANERVVRLAGVAAAAAASATPPSEPADHPSDYEQESPGRPELTYVGRWQIVEPLRSPPRPNTPWVAIDLRGEYAEKLVLKPLSPDPSESEEEAATRTRQAANQLSLVRGFVHQNVADILDAGYDQRNGAYLVNFRYDTDLLAYLSTRRDDQSSPRPFRVRDALDFSAQLVEGAHAIWTRMQRLHLDIKPGNVGLVYGTPAELKLMDFGLTARLDGMSPSGNDSHSPRGTQFYAAPEQWAEARSASPNVNRLSIAADLRGLAATIYRMFVGQPPGYYEAAQRRWLDAKGNPSSDRRIQDKLFQMLETERPQSMDTYVNGLPPGFVALIAQWLNVDPETRNPGPSTDDAQAYGDQVRDSLRFHISAIEADPEMYECPVSLLRKSGYFPGGDGARGGDTSTAAK